MPVYTVHALRTPTSSGRGVTDRFVFVRDGFRFWAFVGGAIWLFWHRLWLGLIGYLVLSFTAEVALSLLGVAAWVRMAAMLVVALVMGLEAASLQRWTLSRRKWKQVDVVVAGTEEEAERRFFDRWLHTGASTDLSATPFDRGGPPPVRPNQDKSYMGSSPSDTGVIGLFPQPGASR